jgi:hypothetical protein
MPLLFVTSKVENSSFIADDLINDQGPDYTGRND